MILSEIGQGIIRRGGVFTSLSDFLRIIVLAPEPGIVSLAYTGNYISLLLDV